MAKAKNTIEISTAQTVKKVQALRKLRWPLRLTRIGLLAENITRAFWPLWSVAFVLWTALSFGVLEQTSLETTYIATLSALAALVWALVAGIRKFHWPRLDEAVERLDSSITGRPLTALWDLQAIGGRDPASRSVWEAHVQRMSSVAARARAVRPNLRISERDPFALRYVATTALVVALTFGSYFSKDAFIEKLDPTSGAALASGPVYEGWIEPPLYTGLPSIYLNEVSGPTPVAVPVGSKVTVRLYGQTGSIGFEETVSSYQPVEGENPDERGRSFLVEKSGDLRITSDGDAKASWHLTMIPDIAPSIALSGPVERTPNGEMQLPFTAADDYGVVSGQVELKIDMAAIERRYGLVLDPESLESIELDIPLPFSGDLTMFEDVVVEDLSKHPWAGLPVTVHLSATDALDQTALATPEQIILPGRRFFDPLAAAIVEQRRDLLWNRKNSLRVAQVLRAVTNLPDDIFDSETAYLVVRSAIRRLEYNFETGPSDEIRDDVTEMLWKAALLIEDGDLSDARARLERAQKRLSEALRNGATEEEIAKLSEELRRAMQELMEQMAREAEQNPDQQSADNENRREVTSQQLQDMLDRIQELARQGRNQEAQELLEQLRQMMESMQTARRQQGDGEGEQSMQDLQDTLRQQQDLSDEAFRQMQEEFNQNRRPGQSEMPNQGQPGYGQDEQGNPQPMSPQDLARRQEALRQLLDAQRGQVPQSDTPEGRAMRESLERAEREMGSARDALRRGDTPDALDNQAEALEALREGIQNLGQDLARNQDFNPGRQGDQAGATDPDANQDPLGRQVGTTGRIGSNENMVPGDDLYLRSRELMNEIRRRSGERGRPKIELDYLERLLDRF